MNSVWASLLGVLNQGGQSLALALEAQGAPAVYAQQAAARQHQHLLDQLQLRQAPPTPYETQQLQTMPPAGARRRDEGSLAAPSLSQ